MKEQELIVEEKLGIKLGYPIAEDDIGHRLMLIWQAAAGEVTEEELALELGVQVRTARGYVKKYQESGSSMFVARWSSFQ